MISPSVEAPTAGPNDLPLVDLRAAVRISAVPTDARRTPDAVLRANRDGHRNWNCQIASLANLWTRKPEGVTDDHRAGSRIPRGRSAVAAGIGT